MYLLTYLFTFAEENLLTVKTINCLKFRFGNLKHFNFSFNSFAFGDNFLYPLICFNSCEQTEIYQLGIGNEDKTVLF